MRTAASFSVTYPQIRPFLRTADPVCVGASRDLAPEELRSGRLWRPPLRTLPSSPASFSQSEACKRACVFLLRKELVSNGPLPLPESGGGHVLRSQSLPAFPGGKLELSERAGVRGAGACAWAEWSVGAERVCGAHPLGWRRSPAAKGGYG